MELQPSAPEIAWNSKKNYGLS